MNLHYCSYLAKLGSTNLHPGRKRATRQLMAALNLRKGDRVLDIGCGTGETMMRIACLHDVFIVGLDILSEMLRVAKIRFQLIRLTEKAQLHLIKTGSSLPFLDQKFDRVYTESVLGFQDVSSAKIMLSEIFRVLKTGGLYVANEAIWKMSTPEEKVFSINRFCEADFGLRQASECAWYVEDWLKLMRSIGFKIVSADRIEDKRSKDHVMHIKRLLWRLFVSNMLTKYYQLKSFFIPALIFQRGRYRKRLKVHRSYGKYIEARMFVLIKSC